jgi:hypothetical protein
MRKSLYHSQNSTNFDENSNKVSNMHVNLLKK